MSLAVVRASSQYAQSGTAGPIIRTDVVCTMSCWYKPSSLANGTAFGLGDTAGSGSRYLALGVDATGHGFIEATGQNSAGAIVTNGAWSHLAGSVNGQTSRQVYVNGVAGTNNASAITGAAISGTPTIGALLLNNARTSFAGGEIAQCAVWNVLLTAAEILALAKGAQAFDVRLGALVFYAPLAHGIGPEIAIRGGHSLAFGASGAAPTKGLSNPPVSPYERPFQIPPKRAAGPTTQFGVTAMPVTFGAVTQASKKTFGVTAAAITFGEVTQGQRKAFGATAFPMTFGAVIAGQRKTFGVVARPITFGAAVSALRKTFGVTATPITFGAVTAGQKTTPAATYYGATAMAITFGEVTQGTRRAFGVVTRPTTFGAVVQAQRKTFGVVARPSTFGAVVQGSRKTFGVVARAITFGEVTQAQRKTFGVIAAPFVFGEVTQGRRKTFGVVARPITFGAVTAGIKPTGAAYGSTAMAVTFGAVTQARRKTFGIVARPITFTAVVQGRRRTFSAIAVPVTFDASTQVQRRTFGRTDLPILLAVTTAGQAYVIYPGAVLNDADAIYYEGELADAVYAGSVKVWP